MASSKPTTDTRRQSGLWDQNAQGFYERIGPSGPYQYYKPPPPSDGRRSFAERSAPEGEAAQTEGLSRTASKRRNDASTLAPSSQQQAPESVHKRVAQVPDASGEQITSAKHGRSANAQPFSFDTDDVPANIRSTAWSPEPTSPTSPSAPVDQFPARHASNASEQLRRGSVPDRSPLQNLEARLDNISKEEKRARLEEAERRSRQKSLAAQGGGGGGGEDLRRGGTLRSEKGRAVSDGSRRANEGAKRDDKRHVSAGVPPTLGTAVNENGHDKFRRASDALRSGTRDNSPPQEDEYSLTSPQQTSRPQASSHRNPNEQPAVGSSNLGRPQNQGYRHRARDAGFVGATAAIAGVGEDAAARGKAAYERRKSQAPDAPLASPTTPTAHDDHSSLGRSESKRLQKQPPLSSQRQGKSESRPSHLQKAPPETHESTSAQGGKHVLQKDRIGAGAESINAAKRHQDPDPVPREAVKTGPNSAVPYTIPPQTSAGQQAREKVGFTQGSSDVPHEVRGEKAHHHLHDFFHRHHAQPRAYQNAAPPLDEWKKAAIARLTAADLLLDDGPAVGGAEQTDSAWWEKGSRRQSGSNATQTSKNTDGPYEEEAQSFRPPLFLKCGPLLRFTGIRREPHVATGKQFWRGSIMILTEDSSSNLSSPPTLRLFAQAMDLHQPPSKHDWENSHSTPPEDEDPITGQVKISRTGRPIYVRPVHDIDAGVDLSREENNHGLFSATRSPLLGPQSITGPDGKTSQHITFQNKSRIRRRDGEKLGKYKDVKGHRIHSEHGCTFWRFNIEIELGSKQARVAYRINKGPAVGFWVPARGETMNIMFHSCNGFSLSVEPSNFCGPDPLWRDVLNRHQHRPFHVMIGGGDQIYNDAAVRDTQHFKAWLQIKNPEHKHHADFTAEMQEELELFYFNRYAMWFSQGLFGMANAQIPMVNIYDDHDIIDGFGSYPHHFMSSPVFAGLGTVAFKYYMLYQHQSVPAETTAEEPSWLLGASPGPYINELSRSVFVWLGDKVALLALDCRTERMRDEVLSEESYNIIIDRCRAELVAGEAKHLIVLLGVPIAYPRLNFLENILTSRVMDPIKALGRTGALGGFVNKFDGGVEILDDLDDHWTAKHHKAERNWFIQELQELAAEKSVRVTILGGDVHLGAVGQFYSNKKLHIPKDKDHRYMPNVISSAIVNTPPPVMMADVLNKRNKVHHLDHETDENMIPMFENDIDGSKRNNKHLLPRRNFAIIREYVPGTTPPPSPPPMVRASMDTGYGQDFGPDDDGPPPMKRTMSLGRGAGSLVRRLSLARNRNPPVSMGPQPGRTFGNHSNGSSSGPGTMQRSNSMGTASEAQRPTFHRRPTNLSIKAARRAAAKGGGPEELADGRAPGHIDLEGGLDITLCMENDQHDPAGHTTPYRLLVPALWYDGPGDPNTLPARRPSLLHRLTGRSAGAKRQKEYDDYDHESLGTESRSESPELQAGAQEDNCPAPDRRQELRDLQATAAGAGNSPRYGASGAFGQPRAAFQKGYDLGSPPIGKEPEQASPNTGTRKWQPGYRRMHAPLGSHPADGGHEQARVGDGDEDEYEDSLTQSDDEYDEPELEKREAPVGRRLSKAERFFGIGEDKEEGLGRHSSDAGTKKKAAWKVWK